jgi:hypothetical protein|tara:strand:- start:818 stop:1393 length:576 start_codon:yes stop_codon:yes gene_type:complete
MKLNLFSIPVYIGNIDVDRVNINNKGFEKTWACKTNSSFNFSNTLEDDSAQYVLNIIYDLLRKDIHGPCKIEILNIWENRYGDKDYQEKHVHPHSHFSFIIYKEIEEGRTVFVNPSDKSILSYYTTTFGEKTNFFELDYEPKCRQGQIIIFPSFLEHMVKGTNTYCVTMSGNVCIHIEKNNQDDKVKNDNR